MSTQSGVGLHVEGMGDGVIAYIHERRVWSDRDLDDWRSYEHNMSPTGFILLLFQIWEN